MRLVYTATQQPVAIGDTVDIHGNAVTVARFDKPHKPDSEGKVMVRHAGHPYSVGMEYYVSVIGAKWIEREDREPRNADGSSLGVDAGELATLPPYNC